MTILKLYLDKLTARASPLQLFPDKPVIHFQPAQTHCSDCHARLSVYKTRKKPVATLHIGEFVASETLLQCKQCENTVYVSEELLRIVALRHKFGYDVLAYVGRALFPRHRQAQEIRAELAGKNILISSSQVHDMGRRFIVYLAIAHRRSAPRIRKAMRMNGGYIFHLDGTCEGKSPVLMCGMDSIMDIILGSIKLPSEKAGKIEPFLRQTIAFFGEPIAFVHDMGLGIMKAIANVSPHTPDFVCHFHFLRDIGKDLLGDEYGIMRKRLKKHKIAAKLRKRVLGLQIMEQHPTLADALQAGIYNQPLPESAVALAPAASAYSLIHWALDGLNQGNGYGFPFDRPHVCFAQRLRTIHTQLKELKTIRLRGEWRDNRPFVTLLADLNQTITDSVLRKTLRNIEPKIAVFDKLRDAMRVAPKDGTEGLNADGADTEMHTIEDSVKEFRSWLVNHPTYSTDTYYQNMLAQLDKYWKKLFADPIVVETPNGPLSIQPQRTNNLLEHCFRDWKQGIRRRTGNKSMSKMMQAMLADTPLVKNLENPEYVEILLEGKASLEELFADIDRNEVKKELGAAKEAQENMPAKIKKIIAEPALPEKIATMFRLHVSPKPGRQSHFAS